MSETRITPSLAVLRGLDTMLHKELSSEVVNESSFANILASVISDVNQSDSAAHNSIEDMVVGDYDQDVVMLNSTKAELSLSLAVAVRDKVVEAYNDIMRMQI